MHKNAILFLKTFKTLSCWYSWDSHQSVLSDEYPYGRVISGVLHFFIFANLATSGLRVQVKVLVGALQLKPDSGPHFKLRSPFFFTRYRDLVYYKEFTGKNLMVRQ